MLIVESSCYSHPFVVGSGGGEEMNNKRIRLLQVTRSDSEESVSVETPQEVLKHLHTLPHGLTLTVKVVTMGAKEHDKLDVFAGW